MFTCDFPLHCPDLLVLARSTHERSVFAPCPPISPPSLSSPQGVAPGPELAIVLLPWMVCEHSYTPPPPQRRISWLLKLVQRYTLSSCLQSSPVTSDLPLSKPWISSAWRLELSHTPSFAPPYSESPGLYSASRIATSLELISSTPNQRPVTDPGYHHVCARH